MIDTARMALHQAIASHGDGRSVLARYPLPPRGTDWRAALETLCRLQWSGYQRHPWLAQWVLHMAVTLANHVRDEWMATQHDVMRGIVASGDFPMLARLEDDPTLDLNLESLFELGLARLLDGLETLVLS